MIRALRQNRAAYWQARAEEHKRAVAYWRGITVSLHHINNGGRQAPAPAGLVEAEYQRQHHAVERDRALARAAAWRVR